MYCLECGIQNPDGSKSCSRCGYPLEMDTAAVSKEAVSKETTTSNYAGFWRRFLAALIDNVILMVGMYVMLSVMTIWSYFGSVVGIYVMMVGMIVIGICTFGLSWLYFALSESSSKQATLGKMAMGIVVTDLDGGRISFWQAAARHLGRYISAITLIGFIMAGFTSKKQALHDFLADTLVVKK